MTLDEALALTDGVYFDVPENYYHQIPRCSSSYLRRLAKNPAYAQLPCEESAAMEFGSAAHAYILQGEAVFNAEYIVMPEIAHHKNSNAYKECYANFQATVNGKSIIEQKEYDKILGCADSIMEHPLASLFLMESFGQPEVTILWTDVETGIQMKCRIDRLPGKKTRAALDLKSTADSTRAGFLRSIVKYGYDTQSAVYLDGLNQSGIPTEDFIFIAVQSSEPYQVLTCMVDPDWMTWAHSEYRRLLQIEAECRERGQYPNFELPEHCGSIAQIYEAGGHDLLEVFPMPRWR